MPFDKMEKPKKICMNAGDKKIYNKICGGTEDKPSFEKLELTRCMFVAILKKRSPPGLFGIRKWQTRRCYLKGNFIYYFDKLNDTSISGCFVKGCVYVKGGTIEKKDSFDGQKNVVSIAMCIPKKPGYELDESATYYFSGAQDTMEEWYQKLQQVASEGDSSIMDEDTVAGISVR